MKTLPFIIVILLSVSCKTQTPIVSLNTPYGDAPSDAYYKDLANQLDPYEGTWISTENGNVFTLVLKKVEQVYTVRYYEDMIIGGYSYVENGVELVNTLADLDNTTITGDDHLISGNSIIPCGLFPDPGDCENHTTKLRVFIEDPTRPIFILH